MHFVEMEIILEFDQLFTEVRSRESYVQISISYEDFVARSRYLNQGYVITSHGKMWDVITYPCLRYLLLATKSSYIP